ncbi:hypothetical protein MJA45_14215 [Paenibacillus aurantius]|uniref:Uncharacterized protein n=1 Tax=Paenibacillus aurantius TaxID=2918900 RepID=A0AA96L847_9BACL|nr:hypothetical protein [Paenibacillus aurantius]WJH33680.1 hypothetical protein N6H14_27285 [Paenibacillus sp. CC-CFT747]WNQ08812.1 hypothetical protein MJA45_14215 [Paenibacillus aurantius]
MMLKELEQEQRNETISYGQAASLAAEQKESVIHRMIAVAELHWADKEKASHYW